VILRDTINWMLRFPCPCYNIFNILLLIH
jgi:hypothetical protein